MAKGGDNDSCGSNEQGRRQGPTGKSAGRHHEGSGRRRSTSRHCRARDRGVHLTEQDSSAGRAPFGPKAPCISSRDSGIWFGSSTTRHWSIEHFSNSFPLLEAL